MNEFERSLNHLLVHTFNTILKYEESTLKKYGAVPVTITEAHMIEAIGRHENGATVGEVAADIGVRMPTATVALKKLVEKGLVTKETCTVDRRRTFVSLTTLGRRMQHAHEFFHRSMIREVTAGFGEDERKLLLTVIDRLNSFFVAKSKK